MAFQYQSYESVPQEEDNVAEAPLFKNSISGHNVAHPKDFQDEHIRKGLTIAFLILQALFWVSSLAGVIYLGVQDRHPHTLGFCAAALILVPFNILVWLLNSQLQRFTLLHSILKVTIFVVGIIMSAYFGESWFYALSDVIDNFNWYYVLIITNWFFASLSLTVLVGHFDKFELLFGDCWKAKLNQLKHNHGPADWNFGYSGGNSVEAELVAEDESILGTFETSTTSCLCIEDGVSEIVVTRHRVVAVSTSHCFPCLGGGDINYASYWNKDQGQLDIRSYPSALARLVRVLLVLLFVLATVCPWIFFLRLVGSRVMRSEYVRIGQANLVTASHTLARKDVPRFRQAFLKAQRIWRV